MVDDYSVRYEHISCNNIPNSLSFIYDFTIVVLRAFLTFKLGRVYLDPSKLVSVDD